MVKRVVLSVWPLNVWCLRFDTLPPCMRTLAVPRKTFGSVDTSSPLLLLPFLYFSETAVLSPSKDKLSKVKLSASKIFAFSVDWEKFVWPSSVMTLVGHRAIQIAKF